MESLALPIMYALIFLVLILAYCALRGLKLLKQSAEQPDPTTRRGRVVSFLRDLPNYRPPTVHRHNQPSNATNTEVQRRVPMDLNTTYIVPVHPSPVGVSGLYSDIKSLHKDDLAAATFPPPVLGAAVPWPGAFGTMIDREFGTNLKDDDSGVFSGSQGRSSLESLSSDLSNSQV